MEDFLNNKKNKSDNRQGYDDLFKGNAEDVLPKTVPETEEMRKILEKVNNYEEEIKKIEQDTMLELTQNIEDAKKIIKIKKDLILEEYFALLKELEEESKALPKWKAYIELEKTVPTSITAFEKTVKGEFLRLKHFLLFGTQSGWWDIAAQEIHRQQAILNTVFEEAMKERKQWIEPRKNRVKAEKETEIKNLYQELLSRDVSGEAVRIAQEKKMVRQKVRNPKNPTDN